MIVYNTTCKCMQQATSALFFLFFDAKRTTGFESVQRASNLKDRTPTQLSKRNTFKDIAHLLFDTIEPLFNGRP